jgi:uncharacterized protein YqjF (DUF2071 family)
MYQNWGKLLFIHWPIDEHLLRPLIPAPLSIDTFEGHAWVGVVPFTMWGIRASFLPALPGTSAFHELNVRTYVHFDGVPGVWFFSLDAANQLAVWGARWSYHLPYYRARMSLKQSGQTIDYHSARTDAQGPSAAFDANWLIKEELPTSKRDSLEFFLTERYCLYSFWRHKLYRSRIFHPPWPLRAAKLNSYKSTVLQAAGLSEPPGKPLLHYAESLAVKIWALREVGPEP